MKMRILVTVIAIIVAAILPHEVKASEIRGTMVEVTVEDLNDPSYYKYAYETNLMAEVSSASQLTHNSRFDNYHKIEGIDISKYQGNISWASVKNDGINFAMIRLGYRGMTDGSLQMDPYFYQNISGAHAVDMPIGIYFFTQAINTREAKEEAQYVINQLKQYPDYVSYPVIIDIEALNGSRLDNASLSASEKTAICKTFCEAIEEAGYIAGVYSNKSYYENQLIASKLDDYYIWMAHYNNQTSYGGNYDMWQYTSKGTVKGIRGVVDKNIAYVAKTPEQVQNLSVKARANNTITLSWDKLANVSGYRIVKYDSSLGKYQTVATTTGNTYKVTGLSAGTEYIFKAQAYLQLNGSQKSYGSYSGALISYTTPKQISGVKVNSNTADSITLEWAKQSGISGYRVYCYDSSGTLVGTKYSTTNSLEYGGLESGTVYQFKVRSYIDEGEQKVWASYSSSVKTKTGLGRVENLRASSASANKVVVKWDSLSGADGYRVCLYNEKTKKYTILGTTNKTSYTISALNAGSEYSVRVAGYVKNGSTIKVGPYCQSLKTLTKPDVVKGVKQMAQTVNSITLTWNAQSGVSGYRVYCYDLDGNLLKYINTTENACTLNDMDSGKYICKVRANTRTEIASTWGGYSAGVQICTRPARVTGVYMSSSKIDRMVVRWPAIEEADGYRVCLYNEETGKYKILGTTTNCNYSIRNLESGTEYNVRVAAYFMAGTKMVLGSYSESLVAKTK